MENILLQLLKEDDIEKIPTILEQIDNNLLENQVDNEQIGLFYKIMCREFDSKKLGDVLITKYIKSNVELTPSLITYLYLREKEKLGLKDDYNNVKFLHNRDLAYTDHDERIFAFNYGLYLKESYQKGKSVQEINYRIIEIILHELWHIYQFSIDKNTTDPLEKLIVSDIELFEMLLNHISYMGMHDVIFMMEKTADEYSFRTAVEIAKKEKLFSDEFIMDKEKRLQGLYGEYFSRSVAKKYLKIISREWYKLVEDAKKDEKMLKINGEKLRNEDPDKIIDMIYQHIKLEDELVETIKQTPGREMEKINLGILTPLEVRQNLKEQENKSTVSITDGKKDDEALTESDIKTIEFMNEAINSQTVNEEKVSEVFDKIRCDTLSRMEKKAFELQQKREKNELKNPSMNLDGDYFINNEYDSNIYYPYKTNRKSGR